MFKSISTILILSEHYRALADWYQKKLDLTIVDEIHHPQDTGVLFIIGNTRLWVGQ